MTDDSAPSHSTPAPRWTPPSPSEFEAMLPGYQVTRLVGRGGMGAVYEGKQIDLDRTVAIKILPVDLEERNMGYAERFKNEARAMARLAHPGIVTVHDCGETANGLLYIVMEFIEGTDVARMIVEHGRLPSAHAMAITAHVCDALAYAHERGIIHRDIKPANIMVGYDGVVKVADFGLAKINHAGQTTGLTQSGQMMGTLHYMAPEALTLGTAVDHRADIYAVGVMLYQMLTGKLPQGLFEMPSLQVPGLDPRYDGIIARALREDRNLRYQSVRELRSDLDSILTQPVIKVEADATKAPAALPTQVRPQRPAGQPPRAPQQRFVPPPKRSSLLPWVAVLVIAGVTAWFFTSRSKTEADKTKADAAVVPAASPASSQINPSPSGIGAASSVVGGRSGAGTSSASKSMKSPAPIANWVDGLPGLLADANTGKNFAREADGKSVRIIHDVGRFYPADLVSPLTDQAVRLTARGEAWGVSIREERTVPGTNDRAYGLDCRKEQKGVRFAFNLVHKSFAVNKTYPWPAQFDWSAPHTLEVRAVGTTLTIILDGQTLDEITDTRIPQGFPAFWGHEGTVIERFEYANLSTKPAPVAAQPSAPANSEPPTTLAAPPTALVSTIPELAALQQQLVKLQTERVTTVFDADVAKLNTSYLGGIDREIAKERAAGRLDGVLALEEEKKLVAAKQPVPAVDDAEIKTAVKNLRTTYRTAFAKLDVARAENLKALTDPLSVRLKTLESDLTKANRIADAKTVRDYRESLAGPSSDSQFSATEPFVNSLGMKFVPVPGTDVLMCIHITRRADYAAYAAAVPGVDSSWQTHPKDNNGSPVNLGDDYPVVGVSWGDAQAFCEWLSSKEKYVYRLPTDEEWSYATGIGPQEKDRKNATPEMLSGRIKDVFPWGTQWPPPKGTGNFDDTSHATMFPKDSSPIPGYTDGFPLTSPVLAFKPNKLGIHDLSGNITQWCADWYDKDQTQRVRRGIDHQSGNKRSGYFSSQRWGSKPDGRLYMDIGFASFRCVVVAASIKNAGLQNFKPTPAPSATSSSGGTPAPVQVSSPSDKPGSSFKNSLGMTLVAASFTNSLGMKFVPVPGTDVMFCIHETRRKDYAVYHATASNVDGAWKREKVDGKSDEIDQHPVVNVSWEDAKDFCAWLSKREGRTFRLPTDHEWSMAVGITNQQEQGNLTPAQYNMRMTDVYPWGTTWPIPPGAGNYHDLTRVQKLKPKKTDIGADMEGYLDGYGYTDGFVGTAPVMSFTPNSFGLYDMGGNVWEACEDLYSSNVSEPVYRGNSFSFSATDRRNNLRSNMRSHQPKTARLPNAGFRAVVELPKP